MLNALMQLARPALLVLAPETAHETTLRALEKGLYPADRSADPPTLAARLGGLALTNPIAVAAGFDKDARVPDAVLGLGCGFAEIGTVTPLARRAIRSHGCSASSTSAASSTGSASTTVATRRCWLASWRARPAASSASTSAPIKTRPIGLATT
jgi:hypothetical protein